MTEHHFWPNILLIFSHLFFILSDLGSPSFTVHEEIFNWVCSPGLSTISEHCCPRSSLNVFATFAAILHQSLLLHSPRPTHPMLLGSMLSDTKTKTLQLHANLESRDYRILSSANYRNIAWDFPSAKIDRVITQTSKHRCSPDIIFIYPSVPVFFNAFSELGRILN